MAKINVSKLLGEESAHATAPKAKKASGQSWAKGLRAAKDAWKVDVGTDLMTVRDEFLKSRRNGTDGARVQNTDKSLDNYKVDIDYFFSFLKEHGVAEWEKIDKTHVKEFVISVNERINSGELAAASGWKVFRTLRSLFNYVDKQDVYEWETFKKHLPSIPNNPARQWIPSKDEMAAFMSSFDQSTVWGLRDAVIATVLLDCGARIGELANLRLDDVLWDVDMIVLFGKKRIPRKVSLSATRTMPLLRKWAKVREALVDEKLKKGQKVSNRFFITRYCGTLDVNSLNNSWRKTRKKMGVGNANGGQETGNITPHTFRHYFCTHYLVNGGKLENLQQITGHTDFKMLMGYTHLASELSHVKEEHRKVSPLDSLFEEGTKKKRKMF